MGTTKNINTMAVFFALANLYEKTGEETYLRKHLIQSYALHNTDLW